MSLPIPTLSLDELQEKDASDLVTPGIMGYSAASWVDAHRKLGPLFKIKELGSIALCGNDMSKLMWSQPELWSYSQTPLGEAFISQLGEGYITASDGDYHLRQRRLMRPYFAGESIQRHYPVIEVLLQEGLAQITGDDIDLHLELIYLFTLLLNRTMVVTDASWEQVKEFAQFEEEFIRGAQLRGQNRQDWYQRPQYQQLKSRVFGYFTALVKRRLDGETMEDNLDDLIAAMNNKEGKASLPELVRDAYLMQAGGAGNIASLICSLLWALDQQPHWRTQVANELRDFDPATLAKKGMNGLKATRAVILETERLFPTTSLLPKRATCDIDLMDYRIPKNTDVLHIFGLSHFLEEEYEQPYEFMPQRWLEGKPSRPNAFGGGVHTCIGMNLSYLYMLFFLKALLPNYSLQVQTPPYLKNLSEDNRFVATSTAFDVFLNKVP